MISKEDKPSIADYPVYCAGMAIVFAASLQLMPHLV